MERSNQTEVIEQVLKLKDGREIYKTCNGFKSFVKTEKGVVTEVSNEYYNQVKHLRKS